MEHEGGICCTYAPKQEAYVTGTEGLAVVDDKKQASDMPGSHQAAEGIAAQNCGCQAGLEGAAMVQEVQQLQQAAMLPYGLLQMQQQHSRIGLQVRCMPCEGLV